MAGTSIEWCDAVWNPVRGCSRVSEGCRNCYAERMAARFAKPGEPFHGFARPDQRTSKWTGRVELIPEKLDEPLRWRKPCRIFANSMSDLFHESLPDEDLLRVLDVIRQNECRDQPHTLQVLTKRAERMRSVMSRLRFDATGAGRMWLEDRGKARDGVPIGIARIFRRLWLGVSVENRATLHRIDALRETPAVLRFVSFEPLLENIGRIDLHGIDWCITGGESGPGARPCDVSWIRDIVSQCREAGVACFVKQVGANVRTRNDSLSTEHDPDVPTDWPEPEDGWGRIDENLDGYRDGYQGAPIRIHLKHPKGGDPAEWPEDLRVREFPEPRQ